MSVCPFSAALNVFSKSSVKMKKIPGWDVSVMFFFFKQKTEYEIGQ